MNELTKKERIMLVWLLDEHLKLKRKVLQDEAMASYERERSIETIKKYELIRQKLKAQNEIDDSVVDW
jgi:hypothetical protein